jgi:tight adherence protein B
MLFVVLVFIAVTGLVFGGYLLVESSPARAKARRLEERLREVGQPEPLGADSTLVVDRPTGPLPALDRAVNATVAGTRLERLIEQAGSQMTPSAFVVISVGCGCVGALLAAMLIPVPFAPAIGAPAIGLPFAWLMYQRSARLKRFEEQFPEALDLMSRAIRAGHAFQTAMGMVGEELPQPVGGEFKKTFDRQNFGLPLKDAMDEMSDRVPILDVRFFVTAVAIQRETGGNLSEILDNLAHVVRERFKIRRQVRVHTAHGRFTAYVLLALPAALAIALSFISPDHMQVLFENRMGQTMVAGAIVMQTVGYVWIRKVIKIEV